MGPMGVQRPGENNRVLRVEHLKVGSAPPLSFEVADGRCLAIEGPSGAGKSRLLRAIADLDKAAGQVFLDGAERREMPAPAWRRLVRYSAAEPAWWTDTARPAFPQSRASPERIGRLMASLGLDAGLLDQPLATISTGERQRLAFIRAVIDDPKVILFDEPTASLDVKTAALVEELIKFQVLAGRSIVIVSHDRGLVDRVSHAKLALDKAPAPRQKLGNTTR